MIDDVRAALTALRARGLPAKGGMSLIEAGPTTNALLALDGEGRPHLLLPSDASGDVPKSETATLAIKSQSLTVEDVERTYLDIACLFESVAEVFEHFVVAVLARVSAGESGAQALQLVMAKWKQFLTPPKSPPGRDRLVALFGELLVMSDLAKVDPGSALESWVGPHRSRHDFRRQQDAIEVKTTRSHTTRRVTVHGEDQLEAPEGGSLHLHLIRLEAVAGAGQSVTSLVDGLLTFGVKPDELFDGLTAAGLPVAELAGTADISFEVRERLTVPIDEQTPRIVPASFVNGARPVGILDLNYQIDLDHVLDSALDDTAYQEMVASFAAPDVSAA